MGISKETTLVPSSRGRRIAMNLKLKANQGYRVRHCLKKKISQGTVVKACNSSSCEAEAGGDL